MPILGRTIEMFRETECIECGGIERMPIKNIAGLRDLKPPDGERAKCAGDRDIEEDRHVRFHRNGGQVIAFG